MHKENFASLVFHTYGVLADHPFEDAPEISVFRHAENQKWFAVTMKIKRAKLIPQGEGDLEIVNFKCAPEVIESLAGIERGLFPAYHMNKTHWLTAALDGSCDIQTLGWLLGISYELTKKKTTKVDREP